MRYLLDTNTCIYIIKRSPPAVYDRFKLLRVGDVGVSAITYCELQFGVAKSSRPDENQLALTEFISPLEVRDFPAAAAVVFGKIRARLQHAGTPVGNYVLLIAAHALYEGLTLVTNNTKEFNRVPGLKVENWIR
ncbi:MAG: type II toxin-antitoxin system VapC family toxin [bacterium]